MVNIDIGIDLGTANTVIYIRDKGIVVNQPSAVAYTGNLDKRIIAVGNKAKKMIGKTPEDTHVCCPIEKGVISELTLAERMLKVYVKAAIAKRKIWGKPNICVCVPSGATEVQKRAVEDACVRTGAKNVYVLQEPFAAAVGLGIDIDTAYGYMIVDIGAGTTDIAVVSRGGINYSVSVKAAGADFDEAIIKYMRLRHNVLIGPTSAEMLKHEIGAVYKREQDAVWCEVCRPRHRSDPRRSSRLWSLWQTRSSRRSVRPWRTQRPSLWPTSRNTGSFWWAAAARSTAWIS